MIRSSAQKTRQDGFDSIIASLCDDFFASPVQKTGNAVTTAFFLSLIAFERIMAIPHRKAACHLVKKPAGEPKGVSRQNFAPAILFPRNLLLETREDSINHDEHDERAKYGHHILAREALA
jgi:hypothetical protein